MNAWEVEVNRLDLNRAVLRYDIEQMIEFCYNSFYLRKLEIQLQAIEYNIAIYRSIKPLVLKQVSHLLIIVDSPLF